MKIAIYARVSSDTQKKDGTIDSQIEALKKYAKTHKLNIAYECLDDGYSGTTIDRPGLDKLRDLAQSGRIEGILILSPDRLSRKLTNQIFLMDEFKKRNIQIVFATQNFTDSPEDNFMLQVHGAVAEYERIKILDRMRRGAIHAAKKGQVNGNNPPYGYRYIPKSKDAVGYWEINREEEKHIRYIFELYVSERLKGTQIADRLNEEQIPCRGNKWWSSHIYVILKSETYKGVAYMFRRKSVERRKGPKLTSYQRKINAGLAVRPREEWIEIPVPPIVDEVTWNNAQVLLKQNANRAHRNNNKNQYLLRRLVVCGLCGSMVSGYVSNKSTYYSCGAKRNKNVTSKPHDELIQVKHKFFDEKIWQGLTELLSDPNRIKEQVQKRLQVKKTEAPVSQPQDEFEKELGQLAAQEKRILDAYREAVISLDELKLQKEKISDRRKVLESKKKPVSSPVESSGRPQISMSMLGDVSARFRRAMAKADFTARETIVNHLVQSVTLTTDKAIVKGNIPIDALITPRQSAHLILNRKN